MKSELRRLLETSNTSKRSRIACAQYLIDNPVALEEAISIASEKDLQIHVCSWFALELAAEYDIRLVLPYAPKILQIAGILKHESAIRSSAKICMLLSKHYDACPINDFSIIELLAERCFDWLVQHHKVATKVYAIYAIASLSKVLPWTGPALAEVMQNDFGSQSPAYKTAAKKVFLAMFPKAPSSSEKADRSASQRRIG